MRAAWCKCTGTFFQGGLYLLLVVVVLVGTIPVVVDPSEKRTVVPVVTCVPMTWKKRHAHSKR